MCVYTYTLRIHFGPASKSGAAFVLCYLHFDGIVALLRIKAAHISVCVSTPTSSTNTRILDCWIAGELKLELSLESFSVNPSLECAKSKVEIFQFS